MREDSALIPNTLLQGQTFGVNRHRVRSGSGGRTWSATNDHKSGLNQWRHDVQAECVSRLVGGHPVGVLALRSRGFCLGQKSRERPGFEITAQAYGSRGAFAARLDASRSRKNQQRLNGARRSAQKAWS
jgi:hypothetical protein